MERSNYSLVPVFSLKFQFYSYLVETSQKTTLKFYFKSRFLAKPSKFTMYFAHDCRIILSNFLCQGRKLSIERKPSWKYLG